MNHLEEEFVNFVGQSDVELIMCISEQYPETRENLATYLVEKFVKMIVYKECLGVVYG